MVQMRSKKIELEKIGYSKFLSERQVSDVRDSRYRCKREKETVRHIFTKCSQLKEKERQYGRVKLEKQGSIRLIFAQFL